MKKTFILIGICLLLVTLDNSLMPFISIKGYYPSLLFTFAICYSVISGKWEGLWIGIFCGILQDIDFISGFGINCLVNMLMCVIAGEIGTNIFKEKMLVPVISNWLLSLLKGVLVFSILYVIGISSSLKGVFYGSIYNTIVSIAMYKIVYNLSQKEYMQRKWRF